ncbi:MAG: hypothetical protein JWP85_574 [Rhodoglobus sp.]|nr:hypothetical protein [Rhodoglobus sp.]
MDALARLEVVTGAFLRDLSVADPEASCADIKWSTTQLAAHLGAVHRWAAANARTGKRNHRTNVPSLEVSAVEWYSESRAELLDALRELHPDAPAYTLSKVDKTVRFWHRRQLFETLVHLWDLRSASDPTAPPPPEVTPDSYADGVSELFDVFLPRSGTLAPLGGGVRLVSTDTGDGWRFGNDWQREGNHEITATVSGPAGELLLWVWNRGTARTPATLTFEGDAEVVQRFEKARLRP